MIVLKARDVTSYPDLEKIVRQLGLSIRARRVKGGEWEAMVVLHSDTYTNLEGAMVDLEKRAVEVVTKMAHANQQGGADAT